MSKTVIKVENLSKQYRLGTIGGRTLHDDLNRWWARVRGRPDPRLKILSHSTEPNADRVASLWITKITEAIELVSQISFCPERIPELWSVTV